MSDWNEQIIWNQQEKIKEFEKEIEKLKLENKKLNDVVSYYFNKR